MSEQKPILKEWASNLYGLFLNDIRPDGNLINRVTNLTSAFEIVGGVTETGISIDPETYNLLADLMGAPDQRIQRYKLFDHIDEKDSDASNALSLFADETVVLDVEKQAPFWVNSEDPDLAEFLNNLLYDTLKLKDGLFLNTLDRNLGKYGDSFVEVVLDEYRGVVKLVELPVNSIWADFDLRGQVHGYKQRFIASPVSTRELNFEPWQLYHMTLPGKVAGSIYGGSLLEDAQLPARMLEAVELTAILSRINAATSRFIYKIPVGTKGFKDVTAYINEIKASVKRRRVVNTQDGTFVSVNDVITAPEDIFIPTRDSGSIEIDKLEARSSVTDSINDIEYFDKKKKTALKMPSSYINEEEAIGNKSLSSGDIRFARRVYKVQAATIKFLEYVCQIHLDYTWYGEHKKFSIQLASINQYEEQTRLENMEMRYNLFGTMRDSIPDMELYKKILGYSEEEAEELLKALAEQKRNLVIADAVNQADASAKTMSGNEDQGVQPDQAFSMEMTKRMNENHNFKLAVMNLLEAYKGRKSEPVKVSTKG